MLPYERNSYEKERSHIFIVILIPGHLTTLFPRHVQHPNLYIINTSPVSRAFKHTRIHTRTLTHTLSGGVFFLQRFYAGPFVYIQDLFRAKC